MHYFVGKIFYFKEGTGCIPPESKCYCYAVDGDNLCVVFQYPILGSCDLKLNINVVKNYAIITDAHT